MNKAGKHKKEGGILSGSFLFTGGLSFRQQLSAKDSSGRTPGMIAAEKGNLEALILINKRGLDQKSF